MIGFLTSQELQIWRLGKLPLQIVDVREVDEYEQGHIEGAVLIPKEQLLQRLFELNPQIPVLCYCRSGKRSQMAAESLDALGWKTYSLTGGFLAYSAD